MARQTKRTTKKPSKTTTSVKAPSLDLHEDLPRPLSLREKNVLEFLEVYIRTQGVSPTYQEICSHFGFASFNSVQRYLKQLESKGYIRLPWSNQKRAITIVRSASALQHAVGLLHSSDDLDAEQEASPSPTSTNISLPMLGRVAAGAPIEALEHNEFIDVPPSLIRYSDRTYALKVQGQSMIEDGIFDGDVILVQRQNTAQNGEIVVAVVEEEATVKRFYLRPKGNASQIVNSTGPMVELKPANSSMTSMWYAPHEVKIRGIVVGLMRRFF
jgi:repressor LexA